MSSKPLLLILCLLAGSQLFSQKVVFDLNGRVNFAQPGEFTKKDTFQFFSATRLDDTTVVRMYSNYFEESFRDYQPNTGYEINGLITVKLTEHFTLRTGMGLQFGSLSSGIDYSFDGLEVYKIDTLYQEISTPSPTLCDCYTNSHSDVSAGVSDRIHQEMISLSIPADIGYDIIPGKFSVRAGAYFHTPLYAAFQRSYVTIEVTTEDDMTKCEWIRVDEKNTSGTGISNFQWGLSAWLNYELFPGLQVEAGVRQQMSDMYVDEVFQNFRFHNNEYKPLTLSAGISYRLFEGPAEN